MNVLNKTLILVIPIKAENFHEQYNEFFREAIEIFASESLGDKDIKIDSIEDMLDLQERMAKNGYITTTMHDLVECKETGKVDISVSMKCVPVNEEEAEAIIRTINQKRYALCSCSEDVVEPYHVEGEN